MKPIFLYLGYTDMAGHQRGWMTPQYMEAIQSSWNNIERIMNKLGDEYIYTITADRGRHDRTHGSEMPEDMLIPVIINDKVFPADTAFENISIVNLAPTVTKLLGVAPDEDRKEKVCSDITTKPY